MTFWRSRFLRAIGHLSPAGSRFLHLKKPLNFYARHEHAPTARFTYPFETDYSIFEQRIEGPNMDAENFGAFLAGEENFISSGSLERRLGIDGSKHGHDTSPRGKIVILPACFCSGLMQILDSQPPYQFFCVLATDVSPAGVARNGVVYSSW